MIKGLACLARGLGFTLWAMRDVGEWEAEDRERGRAESACIYQARSRSRSLAPKSYHAANLQVSIQTFTDRLQVIKWLMQADWAIKVGSIFLNDVCARYGGRWEGTFHLCLLFGTTFLVSSPMCRLPHLPQP
jgi:hypothetical protein